MTMCCNIVPSSTTNFLYISFEGARHIVMNNGPDIRFINTHSECNSGNHNFNFPVHKFSLHNFASVRCHTGVVGLSYCGYLHVWLLRIPWILSVNIYLIQIYLLSTIFFIKKLFLKDNLFLCERYKKANLFHVKRLTLLYIYSTIIIQCDGSEERKRL